MPGLEPGSSFYFCFICGTRIHFHVFRGTRIRLCACVEPGFIFTHLWNPDAVLRICGTLIAFLYVGGTRMQFSTHLWNPDPFLFTFVEPGCSFAQICGTRMQFCIHLWNPDAVLLTFVEPGCSFVYICGARMQFCTHLWNPDPVSFTFVEPGCSFAYICGTRI